MQKNIKLAVVGTAAGIINGLFGAGGGMVLVPLLTLTGAAESENIFSTSVSIVLPICVISLASSCLSQHLPFTEALPYLLGGGIGGLFAAITGKYIPVSWLHRTLGVLILWGGIRYLC